MKKTIIRGRVRVLEKHSGSSLIWRRGLLDSGTVLEFGKPEQAFFSHQKVTVLPFEKDGQTYYVLSSEMDAFHDQRR